jgi:hypothetical protein
MVPLSLMVHSTVSTIISIRKGKEDKDKPAPVNTNIVHFCIILMVNGNSPATRTAKLKLTSVLSLTSNLSLLACTEYFVDKPSKKTQGQRR